MTNFDYLGDQNQDQGQMKIERKKDYFRLVLSAIFSEVMPENVYNFKLLHILVRDILINNLVIPGVNCVTNPDFINFYICYGLSENEELDPANTNAPVNISPEAFLDTVKHYASIDELVSCRKLAKTELEKLNSNDTTDSER